MCLSIPLTHTAHFPGLVDVFIDTSNTHFSLYWLGRCLYGYLYTHCSLEQCMLYVSIHTSTKPGKWAVCVRGIDKHIYQAPLTHTAHFPGLVDVFIDTSNTHCSLSWLGICVYRYEQFVLEVSINTSTKSGKWAVCVRGIDKHIYQARKVSSSWVDRCVYRYL
jgi:hypothetical protein